MAERAELAIVALVLSCTALVLTAPVLGRLGHAGAADVAMALAAACGLGSFGIAGHATLRSARAQRRRQSEMEDAR